MYVYMYSSHGNIECDRLSGDEIELTLVDDRAAVSNLQQE